MNVIARPTEKPAGLFVRDTPIAVPLEGVKVHAAIVGHASRVTMTQRFRNTEQGPIEAVYIFPLPEAAAVCGLAMRVGDRRIEAEVEEREKAFEKYDDAMAAGHGAVLLDAERPNVFTISVGNILPGQEALIELKWVAELPVEGSAIRFMLPTTVAPRYAPNEDSRGVSPTPAERVSPPVVLDAPYGLALDVDVVLSCPVRAIDSPSHPVRVELDGTRARVTLSHGEAAMDRDFVLLVTPLESGRRPDVLVERNADGLATAAVSFVPELPASTAPREVVFLVDRSGSMGGSSIGQVREALRLCLRGLREGDLFNIVGFGSTFGPLFRGSTPYGQATLDQADAHVDAMDADMGGTEILPALRSVLERAVARGAHRQVVILTDGEVTNEAAVIELAEAHRADTRIFTFGIGYGASEHLVRSLARVTMGEAEFVQPGERIEPKVLRQFARLGTPSLRDVKVEWRGVEPKLRAPHRPAAIFNGEAGIGYARFEPGADVSVTLSAVADGKPVSWTVPVDPARADAGDLLATLAARAAIRDLEEGTSALHETLRGSAQRGRREDRIGKAIVELAKAYCLASSRTSFVAIEHRDAAGDQPAAELRRVPVALTHGWGGAMDQGLVAGCIVASPSGKFGAPANARSGLRLEAAAIETGSWTASKVARLLRRTHPAPAQPMASRVDVPDSSPRPHVHVARLQRADGSWRLEPALGLAIGVDASDLLAVAKALGGDDVESIVATLAALRYLETHAADAFGEWRLLAEKAQRWLAAAFASRPAGSRPSAEREIESLMPA